MFARKNWLRETCAESRRPCNTAQLPEITFSRRAIRNIAHFSLNTIQFCISMKVQSANNRIISRRSSIFPSILFYNVHLLNRVRFSVHQRKYRYIRHNKPISYSHITYGYGLIKQFCILPQGRYKDLNLVQRCRSDYAYIKEGFQFLTARISRISSAYRMDGVIAKSVMKYCVSPCFRVCVELEFSSLAHTSFLYIFLPWRSATSVHPCIIFATTVISLTPDSTRSRMLICKQFSRNREGKGKQNESSKKR